MNNTIKTINRKEKKRISFIVPSTNTVVEEYLSMISLGKKININISRLQVEEIAFNKDTENQFSFDSFMKSSKLASATKPELIVWAGTSGSWLGNEYELRLLSYIKEKTGIAAIGCYSILREYCIANSIYEVNLLTPYISEIQKLITNNLMRDNIKVINEKIYSITDNYAFSQIKKYELIKDIVEISGENRFPVIPMCTNLKTCFIAPEIKSKYAIQLIDPNVITINKIKHIFNINNRIIND